MKKFLSYFMLFLIILCFILSTSVFAIDMDLVNNTSNNNSSVNNTVSNTNTNQISDDFYDDDYVNDTDYIDDIDTELPETNSPSAIVNTNSSLPEATLGLGNILNIVLIVVGVLLILLAIAILIRLKS